MAASLIIANMLTLFAGSQEILNYYYNIHNSLKDNQTDLFKTSIRSYSEDKVTFALVFGEFQGNNLKDFLLTDSEVNADIVVINSCTVTNSADSTARGYINTLNKLPKNLK